MKYVRVQRCTDVCVLCTFVLKGKRLQNVEGKIERERGNRCGSFVRWTCLLLEVGGSGTTRPVV